MTAIWKNDVWYNIGRYYVNWCIRASYSGISVKGKENLPQDGAVILVPNHCNTLMDAMVILQVGHDPYGYGARADIFRNPKAAAVLHWLRILPMARIGDGRNAVAGNDETFDDVVDCLDHNVPFCVFGEGTHRTKHSLMPIKKGVWRIATRAAAKLDKPVYVVPVGIDYDDYFRYMKSVRVTFGEPVRVYEDTDRTELLETLHQRISSLITYFPDDENYEKNWSEWVKAHTPKYTPLQKVFRVILAVVTIPLFLVFAILCAPMWIAASILGSKLKDKAWLNSVRFGTKVALLPVLLIVLIVLAIAFKWPWYLALGLAVLVAISHSGFYYLQNFYCTLLNRK